MRDPTTAFKKSASERRNEMHFHLKQVYEVLNEITALKCVQEPEIQILKHDEEHWAYGIASDGYSLEGFIQYHCQMFPIELGVKINEMHLVYITAYTNVDILVPVKCYRSEATVSISDGGLEKMESVIENLRSVVGFLVESDV